MLSTFLCTAAFMIAFAGPAPGAQTTKPQEGIPPSNFNPDNTKKDGLTERVPPPRESVTPEMRGDIHMARKEFREAIEEYKSAPETAILINKIGIAYHQMMEIGTAKKYYQRAIKLNKQYAEAINNLGRALYIQHSYRRALGAYKKALKFSPNSASIWSNYGTAQFARKKYEEAMKAYETAMSIDPEVFEHRGSTGVLLQERTVEERAKFHYFQAKLYAKQGMKDRALLYLRKALEEGYKERDKVKDEPDFVKLRELPEFQEILALQPRIL